MGMQMSTIYSLKESTPDNLLDDIIDSVGHSVHSAIQSVQASLTASSPASEDVRTELIELEFREKEESLWSKFLIENIFSAIF